MGARVTAIFEARDRITPELVKVQRGINHTSQAFGGFDRMMNRSSRGFAREADRMQREIQDLRSEVKRLGSMKETPQVSIDDQATQQIADIRQQLTGLTGLAAGIAIGVNVDGIISEMEAGFKEQSLYAAKGKTQAEMQAFVKKSENAQYLNPYLTLPEAKTLASKGEQLTGANSAAYTENAAKLGVTTRFTPEEHLKMMSVMRDNYNVDNADRIANSIQYMSNNMKDMKDEFVDSIIEYSVQTSKFLDTPEKMATLVGEIGKMGIWSDDKAFDSLKETSLKFTNEGDLANVLKTGYEAQGIESKKALEKATIEASEINKLLNSGDKTDQQIAMGKMMLSVATIQDKNVQKQVLNELGAGPGEDLGKFYAPLLEVAGKLATGEMNSKVGNELEKSYDAAVAANELFEFRRAQNEAKQATVELGSKVAQDVTPAMAFLSEKAAALADVFNNMSDGARFATELAVFGGIIAIGGSMFIKAATAQLRAARALERIAQQSGGSSSLFDDFNSNGSNKKKKGKWWNPFDRGAKRKDNNLPQKKNWSTINDSKDFGFKNPLDEATKSSGWREKFKNWGGLLPKGDAVLDSLKGAWDVTKTTGTNLFRKAPETFKAIGGMLPSGDSMLKGLKIGWEGVKASSGSLARKIPLAGIGIGLGQILTAEDPLKMAGQIGSEILGSAAGAAAGASVGSAVPGLGTAAGGIIGSIVGSFGGAAVYDKVMEWWNAAPATPPDFTSALSVIPKQSTPPIPSGPPIPSVSPAAGERPKVVSVSIPQVNVPLQAAGVLQDIPTMLKMLSDPSVAQTIKGIIERSLLDALETKGGVAT